MELKFIYAVYRILQWLLFPFIVLYFVIRTVRQRGYWQSIGERCGFLPHRYKQEVHCAIWIHAVSVGEVLASFQLMRRLRQELPFAPLFVSCTTLTGKKVAQEKLQGVASGVFYSPFDYCFAVRRVLRTLRPALVVVLETEIWPNLYREVKRVDSGLVVVNARISDRTVGRYRRLRFMLAPVLNLPDRILTQSQINYGRYLSMGVSPEHLEMGGNLKYDFEPGRQQPPELIRGFLKTLGPDAVWIAASTMPPAEPGDVDEDDAVIEAFRELVARHPRLLLILVPRRPVRFDSAAEKLGAAGIPFLRRSSLTGEQTLDLPGVLLLDTLGELGSIYGLADVVFMGGSLPHRGGHNILEPAFHRLPIVVGPHMENFTDIAERFREAGALLPITVARDLAGAVDLLLSDSDLRAHLGTLALSTAESQRGATERAVAVIANLYSLAVPRFRPVLPLWVALWPLSRIWAAGSRRRRKRDLAARLSLSTPVISCGGITMGGVGKTPFVLWLAQRFKAQGREPAILTRGYRRRSPEETTLLPVGASAPIARTGDEAQVLLRSAVAPLGVGADRYVTGRKMEEEFHPGVFLLDDGFQHWRLARTADVVLIDALDPFGENETFPLGRLREPSEALGRADVFVITRADRGRSLEGIDRRLRQYNSRAPIYTSRVVPEMWMEAPEGQRWAPGALPFHNVAAFCGLANPSSFWHTLEELGCAPVFRWPFNDHHRYTPTEMMRLAAQAITQKAEILATTEKDLMNLPANFQELIKPLPLCWLKISVQIDRETEFYATLERFLDGEAMRDGTGKPREKESPSSPVQTPNDGSSGEPFN